MIMTATSINTKELFASLDETWIELLELISITKRDAINTVPYRDSWTAAQLATHVTKSNKAIAQGMAMDGNPAERSPDAGEPNIKKIFLDFETKFKSPEFIVPEERIYDKEDVLRILKSSIDRLKEMRNKVNLAEIIALPIFGEVTKLELLYFVLYHTQRHIHQLKKIRRGLKMMQVEE